MPRWTPWTLAGISLALAIGAIHAAVSILLDTRTGQRIYPKDWRLP